uniref:Uncharacterized protein n=1 Tax=Anopheles darlingi TaxID=43151 RepID=A0A2M4CVC7_ANODA
MDDLQHSTLRVLLARKVLYDVLLGHLRSDGEPALQLLLDAVQYFRVLFGRETFGTGQRATVGGGHRRNSKQTQRLSDVGFRSERLQLHLGQRFRNTYDGFELPYRDWNREPLIGGPLMLTDTRAQPYVLTLQLFGRHLVQPWSTVGAAVVDVLLQHGQRNLTLLLLQCCLRGVHVHVHYMLGQCNITLLIMLILHDEDHIETRKDRRHKVNVLITLRIVPSTKDRVGGCQHRAARVQRRRNASLSDRDRLLLHCLVDSDSIVLFHLVELIDTHHSTVSQHHRTALHDKVPCRRITHHRGCQTGRT